MIHRASTYVKTSTQINNPSYHEVNSDSSEETLTNPPLPIEEQISSTVCKNCCLIM